MSQTFVAAFGENSSGQDYEREVIPFRSNNSAYNASIMSLTLTVGGASCPAGFARRQGFLLYKFLYLNPSN